MFETSIAGSLPKPGWLAETQKLWPRWREEGAALAQAKADATLLWIKAQEDAGLDTVTDGEQSRQADRNHTPMNATHPTLPPPVSVLSLGVYGEAPTVWRRSRPETARRGGRLLAVHQHPPMRSHAVVCHVRRLTTDGL